MAIMMKVGWMSGGGGAALALPAPHHTLSFSAFPAPINIGCCCCCSASSPIRTCIRSSLPQGESLSLRLPDAGLRRGRSSQSWAAQIDSWATECSDGSPSIRQSVPLPKESLSCRLPPPKLNQRGTDAYIWFAGVAVVREAMGKLQAADATEEGMAFAFEGWEESLSCKDVVMILNEELDSEKAVAFLNWLKRQRSFQPNLYVYNVMLKCFRRQRRWRATMELMDGMDQTGLKPDNVTYSTIISCAIRCNLPEEALRWYERMQEAGCTPDAVTYNTIMDVYGRVDRIQEALDIYQKMKDQGEPLDNVSFSTIVKLYSLKRDPDAIMAVYQEMKKRKLTPNVVTFNSMIRGLSRAGRVKQALRIFKDMQRLGVKPSQVTSSLMIRVYGKAGMVNDAFILFDTMKADGLSVDTVSYNSLLSLCAETGLVEKGGKILNEMVHSDKFRPDDWTWNAMVEMYSRAGRMDNARHSFEQLLQGGYEPDTAVYTSLIHGYGNAKDFKSAVSFFDAMVAAGRPLDELVAGTLLSLLCLCEKEEESDSILLCIEKANPRLRRLLDILLKEHFIPEVWKEEFRLLLNELPPNSGRVISNLLMNLCWARNLGDRSHEILNNGISFGVYPVLLKKSAFEWCLNLRSLSLGAARTALHGWLSSLSSMLQQGEELSLSLTIEAGTGRRRAWQETPVNTFIFSILEEMEAPFVETQGRLGWFTATGEDAKLWLQSEKSPVSRIFPQRCLSLMAFT
eukprot:c27391_g1_i2 orf=164-2380(-)